jgi:hypothetical protein
MQTARLGFDNFIRSLELRVAVQGLPEALLRDLCRPLVEEVRRVTPSTTLLTWRVRLLSKDGTYFTVTAVYERLCATAEAFVYAV